jgi:hypothetical protein
MQTKLSKSKVNWNLPNKQLFLLKLGVVVHACNSSTWEAETEASWVRGQSELHSKTVCQKKNSSVCKDVYFSPSVSNRAFGMLLGLSQDDTAGKTVHNTQKLLYNLHIKLLILDFFFNLLNGNFVQPNLNEIIIITIMFIQSLLCTKPCCKTLRAH